MPFLLVFLMGFFMPISGHANMCRDIFSISTVKENSVVQRAADQVFTTQSVIGAHHGWLKLLDESGMSKSLTLDNLAKSDRKELVKYVEKSLSREEILAVIAPNGAVFMIDGHHRVHAAVTLDLDLSQIQVGFRIVKNYTGSTMDVFYKDMLERGWAEEGFLNKLLRINELVNSPARSLVGLSFLYIKENFPIPLASKHFVPRVQFKLIDFVTAEKLFDMNAPVTEQRIKEFIYLLLTNKKVHAFLMEKTLPTASEKLLDFLLGKSVPDLSEL